MKISNYDKYKYDYRSYWQGRDYEDASERFALKTLLKGESGKWFVDIGGSYGRLLDLYAKNYENIIILDYSFETLAQNYAGLKKRYPNLNMIAANVYKLPLKENSIDGAMMIRVLHHIESPLTYLEQLQKVLKPQSIYIQEFANSRHIKQIIRSILKGTFFKQLSLDMRQISSGNYEGSNGEETVFLVFNPSFIKRSLKKYAFKISKVIGTSFYRIPFIKRIIPLSFLLFLEVLAQKILSFLHLTPSVLYKTRLEKVEAKLVEAQTIEQLLVCPECSGDLKFNAKDADCLHCKKKYVKKDNIWDFRAL